MAIDIWNGTAGDHNWANGANWLTGVPSKTTDVLIQNATPAVVASASIGTVNSIINSNPSGLSFESAGTTTKDTVTTFLNNTGALFVDDIAGNGGTTLNIGGALTNGTSLTSATLTIGNTTLSAKTTVTAASLSNGARGTINLTGSSTSQALLDVTGAAGFGAAGVLTGAVFLGNQFAPSANDKSAIEFGSGTIASIANSAQLHLYGNQAFIEDSTALGKNSALSGLASIGSNATFQLESQVAVSTTGALANNRGFIVLDQNGGDGGSSLKVAGALTNSGTLDLGNSSLSSADSITASSLINTGTINVTGSASTQALLNITGAAGFGAAGTLTGIVSVGTFGANDESAIEFASGQITTITGSLTLSGNSAFIESKVVGLGSDTALQGLANVAGFSAFLEIDSNVSLKTTGALLDTGTVNLDTAGGAGGLQLTLGGALSIGGALSLGSSTLSSSSKVITTALNLGTSSFVTLTGAGSNQALIDVTGGTAGFGVGGVLTGTVDLTGNTAIEFKSGTIGTIAGTLTLNGINSGINGNNALIEDSTGLGSNSALNFASVSGALSILNGESVSVITTKGNPTGAATNSGTIAVDSSGGHGSSKLNIAGRLTNLGSFTVGNASLTSAVQATVGALANVGTITVAGATSTPALLDVTGAAGFGTAGIVSGTVSLSGDSAIEFASGQITSVGLGATLHLNGSNAFIEDSTALGSDSALTGLSNVVGVFSLDNLHGSVSTTGALINNGLLELDIDFGSGSSTLSVKTGLTNNGTLKIGNGSLSGSDQMTAATLSNTGTIQLNGAGSSQALLDVTAAAGFGTAGTLTGSVTLIQDSAIEFASGEINTIGAGSQLTLSGNTAFIEDGASNSNSALTGLATVAGTLLLENGASVSTTGAVADSGLLGIDSVNFSAEGGSTLSIAKGLTNTGSLNIGNSFLSSSDSVTVASFVNSGTVNLAGSTNGANFAALNVSGALTNNGSISITTDTETLAGAVSGAGSFSLSNSFGSTTATLQFGSSVSAGQIINETGKDALILKQADKFAATISGFGNNSGSTFLDTIDAANFLFSGTKLNFVENSAGTGGTLTLTDGALIAHILMTGSYSNSSFSLGHDTGTGTLVSFV